jgi:hypothetical protein
MSQWSNQSINQWSNERMEQSINQWSNQSIYEKGWQERKGRNGLVPRKLESNLAVPLVPFSQIGMDDD